MLFSANCRCEFLGQCVVNVNYVCFVNVSPDYIALPVLYFIFVYLLYCWRNVWPVLLVVMFLTNPACCWLNLQTKYECGHFGPGGKVFKSNATTQTAKVTGRHLVAGIGTSTSRSSNAISKWLRWREIRRQGSWFALPNLKWCFHSSPSLGRWMYMYINSAWMRNSC